MRAAVAALALGTLVGCNTPAPTSAPAADGAPPIVASPDRPASSGAVQAGNAKVQVVDAAVDSDALSLIRTKRLEAKAEGRVLVVYVGATWCEPCKHFKAELASGRLDERLSKVSLLAFDADRDGDRLGAAGYTYRYVPFVALPGADGRPADTQQATGRGGAAWRELLAKLDAWQR